MDNKIKKLIKENTILYNVFKYSNGIVYDTLHVGKDRKEIYDKSKDLTISNFKYFDILNIPIEKLQKFENAFQKAIVFMNNKKIKK